MADDKQKKGMVRGAVSGAAKGGGPQGAAVGAIKNTSTKQKVALGLAGLGQLVIPVVLFAIFMAIVFGAVSNLVNRAEPYLHGISRAASFVDGLTSSEADEIDDVVGSSGVPWEIVAATPYTYDNKVTDPPKKYTPAERVRTIAANEPIGPYSIIYSKAADLARKYHIDVPTFGELTDPEDEGRWYTKALAVVSTEYSDEQLDLNSGVVDGASDSEGTGAVNVGDTGTSSSLIGDTGMTMPVAGTGTATEQYGTPDQTLAIGTNTTDKAAAARTKEAWTSILEKMPIDDADSQASTIFATAISWHLGDSTKCTPTATSNGVFGSATGQASVVQANIPRRSGVGGFDSSMHTIIGKAPDFITLNESYGFSKATIRSAAPGYDVFRVETGDSQARDTAVMWNTDKWTKVDAGRVQIVNDDVNHFEGRTVKWDRYATWATFNRTSGDSTVSVISVHHMTNPGKFGPNIPKRKAQYAKGMDILIQLARKLQPSGPVLIGGDFNVHSGNGSGPYREGDDPWAAQMKMTAAGYAHTVHDVDWIFYPRQGATLVKSANGPMVSDHHWLAAKFDFGGSDSTSTDQVASDTGSDNTAGHGTGDGDEGGKKGKDQKPADNGTTGGDGTIQEVADTTPTGTTVSPGDSFTGTRGDGVSVTLGYKQLNHAATIISVGRGMGMPDQGILVALMAAAQESGYQMYANDGSDTAHIGQSGLTAQALAIARQSLDYPHDAVGHNYDSLGLFQMRLSWGTVAQRMDPKYNATKFYNVLKSVAGWQGMPPGEAAQAVERSGYPDAYNKWEPFATALMSKLAGLSPSTYEASTCASNDGAAQAAPAGNFDFSGSPKDIQTVLNAALQQVGLPYVWGGGTAAGPSGIGRDGRGPGFDCSGLVLYAYAKIGVSLPHSSAIQATHGVTVSLVDAKPGDLVFYEPGHIHHVAIYLGNGKIVEAPRTGLDVRVGTVHTMPIAFIKRIVNTGNGVI